VTYQKRISGGISALAVLFVAASLIQFAAWMGQTAARWTSTSVASQGHTIVIVVEQSPVTPVFVDSPHRVYLVHLSE